MGLFKKKPQKEERSLSKSDASILLEALDKGTPCIPFIPTNALRQSLTVLKPEGLEGYFISKIPALYPDGNIRYLYKEEFMLWWAVNGALSNAESKGRTYFFLGLDQPMKEYERTPNEYLSPLILYQSNFALFRTDFQEKLEFFHPEHSPLLELTFIPADQNIKVKDLHVVNFFLVAHLYPPDEREDPSGYIESYEQWRDLQYPIAGKELQNLFDRHIQVERDSLLRYR